MLTRILCFILIFSFFNSTGQNVGRSLFLDGITDYVIVGNDALKNIASDVTIEAYLNPCVISGKHALVSQGACSSAGGFYLGINDGKLEYSWSSNSGCLDNTFQSVQDVIQQKSLTHVAVVHSENSVKFYVNGNETPGILVKGSYSMIKIQNGRFLIGATEDGQGKPGSHFQGNLDEIKFWNLAKKQEDIKSTYKTALAGNETGLIAYFPMEQTEAGASVTVENKVLLTETVVNGLTAGTSYSPIFNGTGESGCLSENRNAVFFKGRESYIGMAHHDSLFMESGMTLEMWVKPCDLNRQIMVSKSWCAYRIGGFSFGILAGGQLGFAWEDDGNCAPTNDYETFDPVIVAGELVHLAVTHDSTDVRIYVNGNYVEGALMTGSFSKMKLDLELPLMLGTARSYNGGLGGFYNGSMSEFRMWSRVLDAETIKSRMHISLTGKEPNLVAYFPLQDFVDGGAYTLLNKAAVTGNRINGRSQGVLHDPYTSRLSNPSCSVKDKRIEQNITFPQIDQKICTDNFYVLNATSSSGLPLSYQLVDNNAPARVKGRILTFKGGLTALVQIIAMQEGDSIYAPASKTTGFVVFDDPSCTIDQKAKDYLYVQTEQRLCNDKPFSIAALSQADFPLKLELLSGPATLEGNLVTLQGKGGEVVIRASHEGDDSFEPLIEEIIISVDSVPCWRAKDLIYKETEHHSCNDKPFTIPALSEANIPLKLELISGPASLDGNLVTLQGKGGEVVIRASHNGNEKFEPLNEEIKFYVDSVPCWNQPDPIVYELITVDKDGKNDFLTIENIHYYPDHTLTILNCWGEEVYKSFGYKNDWNGGQSPSGTYFYSLNIPGRKSYSGSLLLTK
jgi:hypothetical protein